MSKIKFNRHVAAVAGCLVLGSVPLLASAELCQCKSYVEHHQKKEEKEKVAQETYIKERAGKPYDREEVPFYVRLGESPIWYSRQKFQGVSAKTKTSGMMQIGAGYTFAKTRVELLYGDDQVAFPAKKGKESFDISLFTINGYYDFIYKGLQDKNITPYVTAAIGQSSFSATSYKKKRNLAWNAGLGFMFRVFDSALSIDCGYRYAALGKYTSGSNSISGNQLVLAGTINIG